LWHQGSQQVLYWAFLLANFPIGLEVCLVVNQVASVKFA
jgi:hypothetical protein